MIRHTHKMLNITMLLAATLLLGCQKQPQKVRHLNETPKLDSVMMAQIEFNAQLADMADQDCRNFVEADSIQYAIDDFGFWYAKTIKANNDSVRQGQEVSLHIQISEIRGELISDIKHHHIVGSGEFPTAIAHSLTMMCIGEQMRIVAPWYTAYGVDGTSIIKPYSNLLINITIEE